MTCRYRDDCRMFQYIREQGDRLALTATYCDSYAYTECVRFKLRSQGRPVPLDLLPDGSTITAND